MKMTRTQLRTAIVLAFCVNAAILWQVSESATVVPPTPAANTCATITCTPPRICQVDQQSNQPKCVCLGICNRMYKPVCGSNGRTYPNECELNADACQSNYTITPLFNGTCEGNTAASPSTQNETAPTARSPCDSVRCREGSYCQVDQTNAARCACNDICTDDYTPVCGSDGETYPNRCGLYTTSCKSGYNITLAREGECVQENPCATITCTSPRICQVDQQSNQPECVCQRACNRMYQPVCGSNGKTYNNECELNADACQSNTTITTVLSGTCGDNTPSTQNETAPTARSPCDTVRCREGSYCQVDQTNAARCACSEICTMDYSPVCGSDGKTYSNRCGLFTTSCKSGYNITLAREGECTQARNPCDSVRCMEGSFCQVDQTNATKCACYDVCTADYRPVCGSDGKTYPNRCDFFTTSCRSGYNTTLAHEGECAQARSPCDSVRCMEGSYCQVDQTNATKCACNDVCTLIYSPVCGSDGKTYGNRCGLFTASCKSGYNITLAREGDCAQATGRCAGVSCTQGARCQVNDMNQTTCVCNEACTKILAQVCGSDGTTYGNQCELDKAACKSGTNISVVNQGECGTARSPCDSVRCMEGSYCQVDQTNATKCACNNVCTLEYSPVCGSDGKTYGNRCGLFTASCKSGYNITLAREGDCAQATGRCAGVSCTQGARCQVNDMNQTTCVCNEACTKILAQVCGSDGTTYGNQCELDKAACKSGTNISVVNQGECGTARSPCDTVRCREGSYCQVDQTNAAICACSGVCTTDYSPVCGSDGKTYSNRCDFFTTSCKSGYNTTLAHEGACAQATGRCAAVSCTQGAQCQMNDMNQTTCVCNEACSKILAQVCGSDGKTYGNQCELDKAACKSGTSISVVNQGECGKATDPCAAVLCPEGKRCQVNEVNEGQCVCNEVCKENYAPVCGSDGKTYSNQCALSVERCKRSPKLTVACQGTCQKSGKNLRCRGTDI